MTAPDDLAAIEAAARAYLAARDAAHDAAMYGGDVHDQQRAEALEANAFAAFVVALSPDVALTLVAELRATREAFAAFVREHGARCAHGTCDDLAVAYATAPFPGRATLVCPAHEREARGRGVALAELFDEGTQRRAVELLGRSEPLDAAPGADAAAPTPAGGAAGGGR